MRRVLALLLLVVAAVTVAVGALSLAGPAGAADDPDGPGDPSASTTPSATPSATLSATPSATPSAKGGAVTLDDATLRWGMSNESSNRAYAPNTYNFFSAGTIANPGHGGWTIPQSQWQQQVGNVAIQKWDGSAWQPATWAGLSTDSTGRSLGSPTDGTFSGLSYLFTGGQGTVDAAAGTARLSWNGDVTVLYYSGMSFFTISDPVLDIAGGVGHLTATVSGYASSVSDPASWAPVPAQTVTLADLPSVDLSDARGFTATPAYLGVSVTGTTQVTGTTYSGSFPQSFVDYMQILGTGPFWYSSGGAEDAFKVALPLTVGFDAATPPPAPAPSSAASPRTPVAAPTAVPPPVRVTVTTTPTAGTPVSAPAAAAPAAPPPAPLPSSAASAPMGTLARPVTESAALDVRPAAASYPARHWPYWAGSGLLVAAALLLLVPSPRRQGLR